MCYQKLSCCCHYVQALLAIQLHLAQVVLVVHSCYYYSYPGHALEAASGDVIAPRWHQFVECAQPAAAYSALFTHDV